MVYISAEDLTELELFLNQEGEGEMPYHCYLHAGLLFSVSMHQATSTQSSG